MEVFAQLWQQYRQAVPQVPLIEDVLRAEGELWVEDHVALRTLPGPETGAHILQAMFALLGYRRRDDLYFADKQLRAFWLEPPMVSGLDSCQTAPKVFISELIPDQFSPAFQEVLYKYTSTVQATPLAQLQSAEDITETLLMYLSGRPWQRPQYADYQLLLRESEYAAWTLAFGHRVNHFTVSVHLMKRFAGLVDFNKFLTEQLQIPMNTQGGLIKGSPQCGLEQSATLGAKSRVEFQEGLYALPYAFVEFAFRHPLPERKPDGRWDSYYQGFVVSNADRIFDSTNVH
ncbi:DUF1338 domain-containing protein [Candidatus Cyanaurora vandensis]|nr:DUF1338 domain-containing protein [Candidatus Cyanaurora vandensis]